jgi:protein TonB
MDATCIASGMRLPADFTGETSGNVSIKFVVGKDGVPGEVEVLTGGTPAAVQAAIRSAVAGCRWSPGLDETWAPKAMWVVLPVRFGPPAEGVDSLPSSGSATEKDR